MRAMVCMCCGEVMGANVSRTNPNVCAGCESIEWDLPQAISTGAETLRGFEYTATGVDFLAPGKLSGEVPSELQRMIEVEDPSVVECLDAEIAAKKAIAEVSKDESKIEHGSKVPVQ